MEDVIREESGSFAEQVRIGQRTFLAPLLCSTQDVLRSAAVAEIEEAYAEIPACHLSIGPLLQLRPNAPARIAVQVLRDGAIFLIGNASAISAAALLFVFICALMGLFSETEEDR